jgi:hypothetical protein
LIYQRVFSLFIIRLFCKTAKIKTTISEEILEQLAEGGMESIPELIQILVNNAMTLQREDFCKQNDMSEAKIVKDM